MPSDQPEAPKRRRNRPRAEYGTYQVFLRSTLRMLVKPVVDIGDGETMRLRRSTLFAASFPRIDHLGVRRLACGCSKRLWRRKTKAVLLDCPTHGVASWNGGAYAEMWDRAKEKRDG